MKKDYFIFNSGEFKRKDNSLTYILEDRKIDIPLYNVENVYIMGKTVFNTDLLNFISKYGIIIYVFDYYGNLTNAIVPPEEVISGHCTLNQVRKFDTNRLDIAKVILNSAKYHIIRNLKKYDIDYSNIKNIDLNLASSIEDLMGREGLMRRNYYQHFNDILKKYKFTKRTKRPPADELNCLISFGNSLCYTTCLKAIRETQLNPTLSYLHEPSFRRYSLSLDIAEIFKPIIVDRIIFKLINKSMLNSRHFIKEDNMCYLNEAGKKLFLEEYQSKLNEKIYINSLQRNASCREIIKLECLKLLKYINEDEEYQPLKLRLDD